MSSVAEVREITRAILLRTLPPQSVQEVRAEEDVDADGQPALRVLAVVTDAAVSEDDQMTDARLDAAAELQYELGRAGERRFAYLRIATAGEVDADEASA